MHDLGGKNESNIFTKIYVFIGKKKRLRLTNKLFLEVNCKEKMGASQLHHSFETEEWQG